MRLLSDNPTSPKMRRTVELKVENKRHFNTGSCARILHFHSKNRGVARCY